MKNHEVAAAFREIATLLDIEGKDRFKPQAYRRAARAIEGLGEDVESIAARDALTEIPGIGKSIAEKIKAYLETGHIELLDRLRARIPVKVMELEAIPGVGPKTIRLVYKELGVTDLESLERAARSGKLAALHGLGKKTEQAIIEGISLVRAGMERVLLSDALATAEPLRDWLASIPGVRQVTLAGSIRRRRETVRDIDIIVDAEEPGQVSAALVARDDIEAVIARGPTKTSVRLTNGMQVDVRFIPSESFGAGTQYFTGSRSHNIRLRDIAKRRGLRLNEYGLFRNGERLAGAEESGVYEALGMPLIPPELREDQGEVEAALKGSLPPLVTTDDIRGDLHSHTDASDGVDSLEAMVAAADARGYEYLCISDHSKSLSIANGLDEERLLQQVDAIREINSSGRWRVRILTGIEVDILPNGELDLSDDVLAQLDVVIASVHSRLKDDRETMTGRICSALQNRHVDVLGHPTGRLLLRRPAYDVDLDAVFETARENNVAMELNALPRRLDLNAGNLRAAVRAGLRIAVNTDAHRTSELDNMRFGVFQARRGWLTCGDVLNTLPLDELLRVLHK